MSAADATAGTAAASPPPDAVTSTPSPHHQSPTQPPYAETLASFRSLSAALSTFLRRHDDLQSHLESLLSSVDSELTPAISAVDSKLTPSISPPSQTLTLASAEKETEKPKTEVESPNTEVESLCAAASIRGLRRYITANLSKLEKLRAEVPQALKLTHNPANFVIRLFGRFYYQGIRAYDKDSAMIPARQVSVLVLEFYLLMDRDGTQIDDRTTKEAEVAAVDWRKRLESEGGLAKADLIDGRGLLLLIGCFGIPKVFTSSDIKDLIFASNMAEISNALRRSSALLKRVPAIIERMMKNKDYKVVDIIYAFGMESRFPPQPFLASSVQESIETWNKAREAARDSLTAQMDANKKHLVDLKSVLACLKAHKLNSSEILPGYAFTEKISTLERAVADLKKKIGEQVIDKRSSDDPKPIRRIERREEWRDEKRARLSDHMPRQHSDHDYLDGRISSALLTPIRVLDVAFPGHLYPPPYEVHRALPEIRGGGGLLVDRVGQVVARNAEPYMLHEDAILRERVLAEREVAAVAQRYAEPLALGVNGLFRRTTPLEGFAGGLSNPSAVGTSNRAPTSASDLYQFADIVAERELFGGPRSVPSVVPPRRYFS